MGSPESDKGAKDDENPQHPVRITRPIYLGATEVTVGQFRRVVEATGLPHRGGNGRYGRDAGMRRRGSSNTVCQCHLAQPRISPRRTSIRW